MDSGDGHVDADAGDAYDVAGASGPARGSPHVVESTPTLPNLADRSSWPSPVDDTAMYSFVLFDLLEYQRTSDLDALRWDILGWLGGDYNRFWFKSEGRKVFTSQESSEVEAQALWQADRAVF